MSALSLTFADEACARALADDRLLAAMARFEAALASACASAGLVSEESAKAIAAACASARFDAAKLARDARDAGTLAIPFVKELTAQVASRSPEAARHVHLGATSQDVQDCALVLVAKDANARIDALATQVGDAAAALARMHADTPCLARTLLQPALPVPFGWKAAVWLSLVNHSLRAFRAAAAEACVLQFGGPAGTLSAFGDKAGAVEAALANQLALPVPEVPWHSRRDSLARYGSAVAALSGAAGKIARDVALLMQPEIGEAAEPSGAGRGGSSAMPHKRNPAQSVLALEAAHRAPALAATLLSQIAAEHERGIGQWQSQWLTLRELLTAAASGLAAMAHVLGALEVRPKAMLDNIERTQGMVYSEALSLRLVPSLGKQQAHALVERLCAHALKDGKHLLDAARADAQVASVIPAEALRELFRPQRCYGNAPAMIERALAAWMAGRG